MGSTFYDYQATVTRVLDGDTLDVAVDLGFGLFLQERVRLFGLNAPERHSKDPDEKTRGVAAWTFLVSLVAGKAVRIKTAKAKATEKYGRWLAVVYLEKGLSVNQQLLDAGQCKPWDGDGPRPI